MWPNVVCDARHESSINPANDVIAIAMSRSVNTFEARLPSKFNWVQKYAQGVRRLHIGSHDHLPNFIKSLQLSRGCPNLISLEIHSYDTVPNERLAPLKAAQLPKTLRHLSFECATYAFRLPSLAVGSLKELTSLYTRRAGIVSLPRSLKRLEFGQWTRSCDVTSKAFQNSKLSLEVFLSNDIFDPNKKQNFVLRGNSFSAENAAHWRNLKYLELWFPKVEVAMPSKLPLSLHTLNLIKMHAPDELELVTNGFKALQKLENLRRFTISPYRKSDEIFGDQDSDDDDEENEWNNHDFIQSIISLLKLSQLEHLALLDFFPSSVRAVAGLLDQSAIHAIPPLCSLRILEVSTIGVILVSEYFLNHFPNLETLVIVHQQVDTADEDIFHGCFMEAIEKVVATFPHLRTIYTNHFQINWLKGTPPGSEAWLSERPNGQRIAGHLVNKQVLGLDVWEEITVEMSGKVEWDRVEEGKHGSEVYCRDREIGW